MSAKNLHAPNIHIVRKTFTFSLDESECFVYGTGIRRIFALYENCPIPVTIDVTPNSFKITLPNMNAAKESSASSIKNSITPQMQRLLDYLREHEGISDEEVQSLLNIKRTRAFNLTKQMAELGFISIVGRGKNRKIILNVIE